MHLKDLKGSIRDYDKIITKSKEREEEILMKLKSKRFPSNVPGYSHEEDMEKRLKNIREIWARAFNSRSAIKEGLGDLDGAKLDRETASQYLNNDDKFRDCCPRY
jgi:hypothetical protein